MKTQNKTKEEKIAFIRDKAIEANPSILDLKFGCEVYTGQKGWIVRISPREQDRIVVHIENDSQVYFFDKREIKILGRPIRLADVLLLPDTDEMIMANDQENALSLRNFVNMWNLRKDYLTLQSDETIEFIYQLLK